MPENNQVQQVYIFDGKAQIESADQIAKKIQKGVFQQLCIVMVVFTLTFLVFSAIRLSNLSTKMTLQIVRLYESLELITSNESAKSAELSFKKSSKELNELSLTFNKVAKTIKIATTSIKEGDEAQALLNYHEAFNIFSDFKNVREQGVCLNNIGTIFMKRHEYLKAYSYFERATQLQQ